MIRIARTVHTYSSATRAGAGAAARRRLYRSNVRDAMRVRVGGGVTRITPGLHGHLLTSHLCDSAALSLASFRYRSWQSRLSPRSVARSDAHSQSHRFKSCGLWPRAARHSGSVHFINCMPLFEEDEQAFTDECPGLRRNHAYDAPHNKDACDEHQHLPGWPPILALSGRCRWRWWTDGGLVAPPRRLHRWRQ